MVLRDASDGSDYAETHIRLIRDGLALIKSATSREQAAGPRSSLN
jgi:hypothetical protein